MENARGIPLLLVDDNPWVHQNLQRLVIKHPNIQLVGQVSHCEDALEGVRLLRPKVVLINIHMPGMDAVSTAQEIRLRYPTVVVIGLNLIAQDAGSLEGSTHEEDTAKRFRALGEPILHAIWKRKDDHSNSMPPPYKGVC